MDNWYKILCIIFHAKIINLKLSDANYELDKINII